jgi:hypothetical protein
MSLTKYQVNTIFAPLSEYTVTEKYNFINARLTNVKLIGFYNFIMKYTIGTCCCA